MMMVRGDSGRKVFSKEREIITETRHLSEMMLLIQIRQSRRDGEEEDGEDDGKNMIRAFYAAETIFATKWKGRTETKRRTRGETDETKRQSASTSLNFGSRKPTGRRRRRRRRQQLLLLGLLILRSSLSSSVPPYIHSSFQSPPLRPSAFSSVSPFLHSLNHGSRHTFIQMNIGLQRTRHNRGDTD